MAADLPEYNHVHIVHSIQAPCDMCYIFKLNVSDPFLLDEYEYMD